MSSATNNNRIEARSLSKYFGRQAAIKDLSFSIAKGEVVGFLGPNGAGKTTTMRILAGLLPATSGEAHVAGHAVAREPTAAKRNIGYMPEHNPLPEDMRVAEYLRFRARLKEVPRRDIRRRVDEAMELCDLHRKASRRIIGALSKGFRQRVGIADAILGHPDVIILDEPTIGLDPHQVILIRKLIDRLRERTTMILSSHILAEVEMSCDRVLILSHGRLVAEGNHASLRREFIRAARYRAEILGAESEVRAEMEAVSPELRITSRRTDPSDGFVTFELETPAAANLSEPLLARLHASPGLRVRAFGRIEPRLEDIFLAATQRSWELETGGEGDGRPTSPAEKTPAARP